MPRNRSAKPAYGLTRWLGPAGGWSLGSHFFALAQARIRDVIAAIGTQEVKIVLYSPAIDSRDRCRGAEALGHGSDRRAEHSSERRMI